MAYITIDIDLDEFDTDDLLYELRQRGELGDGSTEDVDGETMLDMLKDVWIARRNGKPYDRELDLLIYYGLGKVV